MMESGNTADIEEASRIILFNRLWELARKGVMMRSIPEYTEYRKLLDLFHEGKI